ncbi:MAG: hypothetical protein GY862_24605 [Gammaproteobacteria bacterium]|nr:hypothetical protein [Gammaproteobacteria bacterium]
MTKHRFRKLHTQDVRFITLILLNVLCIFGFFFESLGSAGEKPGPWRKVDIEAIEKKMQAGDLTRHEAEWYRAVPPGPLTP